MSCPLANRWHESLTHKLWYALNKTHVIAQVVAVGPPGVYTYACESPSGLGVHGDLTNSTPEHALRLAEQTLLELGWTAAGDAFEDLREFA